MSQKARSEGVGRLGLEPRTYGLKDRAGDMRGGPQVSVCAGQRPSVVQDRATEDDPVRLFGCQFRRRYGQSKFARVLARARAEENLWTSFNEASEFAQRGDVGDVREDAVAEFLRRRLPSRFAVASGEVVDTGGTQSSQTDIVVYDADLRHR